MILFAASGPGVTYRDAPRTLGDDTSPRYVILLSAPQRKRTEESCPGSDVQPSTDRPIALSGVNRSSRARHFQTVKTLLPLSAPTRNYEPWKKIDLLRVLYCRDLCISYPRRVLPRTIHRRRVIFEPSGEETATWMKVGNFSNFCAE